MTPSTAAGAGPDAAAGAGPLISGGELLVGVAPTYPFGAERRKISGTVTARLTVDANGHTRAVEIIAADPSELFDRAVIRALSNWRFEPSREDGVAVSRTVVQQLQFAPDSAECNVVTGTRLCRKIPDGDRRGEGVTVIRLR